MLALTERGVDERALTGATGTLEIVLSPRNRELLGLIPAALLVTAGFTAIFIQAENNSPGASTNFTLNHASGVSLTYGALFLGLCLAAHLVIRFALPHADPYLFPLGAVLASVGIVMVYRINPTLARQQAQWMVIGLMLFAATIIALRRRGVGVLERYRYSIAALGIGMAVLPRFPGIGEQVNFVRILDDQVLVLRAGEGVVDKADAGQAHVAELKLQAGAGLTDDAEVDGRRDGRADGLDGLGAAVVGELEIGRGQAFDRVALVVDGGDGQRDGADSRSHDRALSGGGRGLAAGLGAGLGAGGQGCREKQGGECGRGAGDVGKLRNLHRFIWVRRGNPLEPSVRRKDRKRGFAQHWLYCLQKSGLMATPEPIIERKTAGSEDEDEQGGEEEGVGVCGIKLARIAENSGEGVAVG